MTPHPPAFKDVFKEGMCERTFLIVDSNLGKSLLWEAHLALFYLLMPAVCFKFTRHFSCDLCLGSDWSTISEIIQYI